MPLNPGAIDALRANLQEIQKGNKVRAVSIGTLTAAQLAAINVSRVARELDPIVEEVVFVGGHIYKSRVLRDGYTIEDAIDQISSAMSCDAEVRHTQKMTAMENPNPRADRYGNQVRDRAIFECSTRHPRPELFSVQPKGDFIKPQK